MKATLFFIFLLCAPRVWAADVAMPPQVLSIVRADGVRVDFTVELATNEAQRRHGLMGRRQLAARHGMLFDFEQPIGATMWMKDTPLALDMLFIDERGVVVWLRARTTPGSLALITTPHVARYVLELNGGEVQSLGIAPGDRVVWREAAARLSVAPPLAPQTPRQSRPTTAAP